MFLLDAYYTCGGIENLRVAELIINLVHTAYNLIRIVVPVLLIFFGMLDLGKAVMAQKEDEIKKGQQTFVKRLVAAVIVFLVFFMVQLVIGLVAPKGDENNNIFNCIDCFINGISNENCESVD